LSHLSIDTKVDHYSKVLHSEKVSYLFLYAIPDNEKLSQRILDVIFSYSSFKVIFNLDESETVGRSSISERLTKIDSGYFKEIFGYMIYRILIVEMPILIYKKANNLGYKTAKRIFVMKQRDLITAIMIILSGGDLAT
jgi:hypothetical protein